ncbi:unnamed protein product [Prorocentrum cordatum]|uniref:RING-type domain-containing protein n=1 Tax=Prorocentrum cordatum TaxID=2364126 RepID=A0ABN9WQ76_9DINO|nr:unnamed protein product [Polarella glacialis]
MSWTSESPLLPRGPSPEEEAAGASPAPAAQLGRERCPVRPAAPAGPAGGADAAGAALRQLTRESMHAEVRIALGENFVAGSTGVTGVCLCAGMSGVAVVAEGCLVVSVGKCARRHAELVAAVDARMRPGFARGTMHVVLTIVSTAWKVAWCFHSQGLVEEAGYHKSHGCADILFHFMSLYSYVLLAQVLGVQPVVRLVLSATVWAATRGILVTARGARPGTLEALEVVEFNAAAFADADDPADARPQRECPICLEEYSAESTICRTRCQHLMHRDCLGRWLQASHYCPLCRADVEEPGEAEYP